MRRSILRTVAGVSALATIAALSATTVPAFAAEYEAVQNAEFVETYATEDEQRIAAYLLKSDFSMEETAEVMESYPAYIASVARASSNPYYRSSELYTGEHQIAFFANNPSGVGGNVSVSLSASKSNITYFGGTQVAYTYEGHCSESNNPSCYVGKTTTSIDATFYGFADWSDQATPRAFGTMDMTLVEYKNIAAKSEAALYNAITFTANAYGSTISFHTFKYADPNHDGVIDGQDMLMVASYLARLEDSNISEEDTDAVFDLGFTDISKYYAIDLGYLAADITQDGTLNNNDLVKYQKYISGQIDL